MLWLLGEVLRRLIGALQQLSVQEITNSVCAAVAVAAEDAQVVWGVKAVGSAVTVCYACRLASCKLPLNILPRDVLQIETSSLPENVFGSNALKLLGCAETQLHRGRDFFMLNGCAIACCERKLF